MINLTPLFNALIALVAILISTFLIPWIKANVDEKKQAKMLTWVNIAVDAAEKLYEGSKRGEEKKAYVVSFLEERGYTADMEAVNAAIEAAVLRLSE